MCSRMIRPSAVIATFVCFPASKGTRTLVSSVHACTGSVAAAALHACPVSTLSSSTWTPSQNKKKRVDVITFKFCLKILDLLVLIHISLLLTYFSSSSLGTSLISLYNSFYFSSYQDFFLSTALIAVHGGICSTGSRISYSFFF